MTPAPTDDEALVRAVLREHGADEVGDLEPLKGGVFSRAYGFQAGGQAFVIRLSRAAHAAEAFAKDDFAARHFASPSLPIPRITVIGAVSDGYYAIGERVPGRTLEELPPSERLTLLPAKLDTVDALFRADVNASRGYGHWDATGTGLSTTWHGYLATIIENETAGFFRDWHALFRDSFLERDVYETGYLHMLKLATACPEERVLVHNDYQFENVLTDGRRITGVIDWANALYGDPLYEVARLVWWSGWPGWWYDDVVDLLRARYGAAPRYDERIACYTCHLVLDDLRYYARQGLRSQYEMARDRLLALISTEARGS